MSALFLVGDDFVLHRRIGFHIPPAFDIQLFPVVGKFDRDFPYPRVYRKRAVFFRQKQRLLLACKHVDFIKEVIAFFFFDGNHALFFVRLFAPITLVTAGILAAARQHRRHADGQKHLFHFHTPLTLRPGGYIVFFQLVNIDLQKL
ncbi:hypothetical protein M702_10825 [Neisseria gonorrhoeae SK28355]|uniref:Uncharacterized protein n=1 Tax=Neisseria gonorrhoeae (strain NCCP11945) TaxID=521006 RepID=B4RPL7_NEIG2|nr:Hypothetical protein NGK_2186 [Neisseria gonorrhoeae NCCP11945]KLR89489.1 hypothetical protein M702_10825 [Neisseria gonorrhoeae SK28355]KLS02446.1 hypothetical protein M686_12600 [Neisseria gonorrhoeae SK16942]KLS08608.1 hypothetical protein M716_04975 [Neisseria gonorrhoeae SK32402]KLS27332.1 hypothetical protein M737_11295 [Neisseria gonorrhoeae MIA_2011_05-10]KLS60111.1 hypothetical protein M742_01780 [Neisseria gonorrhoeae NYC_2011_05_07]KLS61983.1 hypothetical protein M738_08390 [Nei